MKGILCAAAAAVMLSISTASDLSAQPGIPGDDVASLGLHIGAVSQTTTLPDGGSFDPGVGGGISANFWPFKHVGIGGTLLYAKNKGNPGPNDALMGREDPSLLIYDLELALRRPMGGGDSRFAWFPYLGIGGGGKTYQWSEWLTGHEYDFTYSWGFSGGVEVRPTASPWYGFLLEIKRYDSHYKWHGYHITQPIVTDFIITTGITLNR